MLQSMLGLVEKEEEEIWEAFEGYVCWISTRGCLPNCSMNPLFGNEKQRK